MTTPTTIETTRHQPLNGGETWRREMTNATTLIEALDRSRGHNESVAVDYASDVSSMLADLHTLYDGGIDHARENDGTIDVWGYTEDMAEGEMEWRLRVTLPNWRRT